MQHMAFKWSAVALAVGLTACGGGGSSSSSSGSDTVVPVPEQSTAFTVSGNAVKGPMNKAVVVAYKVNADGTKGDELGRDVSDEAGGYDIAVKGYTGLVLVEVTVAADTTMVDESTGTTITPPAGFTLRASVASPVGASAQSAKLSVQVNPLTEMAVASAVKSGGLSVANIETANAELRTVYGFSPTDDAPVFVNGVPQNKAAVTLFAISNMAKANDLEACVGAENQAAKVKCVIEEMAAKGAQNAAVASAVNLQIAVVAKRDGVPAGAVPTINTQVPPAAPEATAVAQAKAMMASLRSNAQALSASDLSLQTKLMEVQTAVDNTVQPVVESTFEMLRTMDFGVQLLEDAQAGKGVYGASRSGTPYGSGCTVYTGDTDDSGNFTFRTTATTAANAKVVGCSSYSVLNIDAQDSVTGVPNTWRWRHRLLIAPKVDAQGTYVVKTMARREYISCTGQGACGAFSQTYAGTANQGKPVPVGQYTDNSGYSVQRGDEGVADFTRTLVDGNLTALRLSGTTAPSLRYRGLGASPVLDNGNGRYHEVNLDVVKTTVNGLEKIAFGSDAVIKFFSRDSANTPTVFRSSIGIGKDSYLQAPAAAGARDGTEAFKLAIGYVAGNSALRGSLEATNSLWDKSKTAYMPTKLVFGGRLETRATSSSDWVDFWRGNLALEALNFAAFDTSLPRSSTNPQTMKATLNAAVTIPNRPVLAVRDLMVVGTDQGLNQNAVLSGQYVQGSLVINLNGTSATGTAGRVTLESSTGIKLDYDESKTVHPLTKSGIKVGEYNASTQRIDYIDGTFEQF